MSDDKPLTDMNGDNPPEAWTAEQAKQAHEAAMAANQEAMNRLAAQGHPLDPFTMLKMRLDFLTQWIIPADPQQQFAFAMGWEQFLGKVLEGAEQSARMQTLALPPGVTVIPGQLEIPGA